MGKSIGEERTIQRSSSKTLRRHLLESLAKCSQNLKTSQTITPGGYELNRDSRGKSSENHWNSD
jgi:hypothetical protein